MQGVLLNDLQSPHLCRNLKPSQGIHFDVTSEHTTRRSLREASPFRAPTSMQSGTTTPGPIHKQDCFSESKIT